MNKITQLVLCTKLLIVYHHKYRYLGIVSNPFGLNRYFNITFFIVRNFKHDLTSLVFMYITKQINTKIHTNVLQKHER